MAKAKSLVKSRRILRLLLDYLEDIGTIKPGYRSITLRHDPGLDRDNRKSRRSFCATQPRSKVILCSKELEMMPVAVIGGVLLHEIGHIVNRAFRGDECEVIVDDWCASAVPEAEYGYVSVRYVNTTGEECHAKNVQVISVTFLQDIMDDADEG